MTGSVNKWSPNYVLRGRTPVLEPSYNKWWEWFHTADRLVARDELPNDVVVDTFFLGTDFGLGTDRPPLLFHTYIAGGPRDGSHFLEPTWSTAVRRHRQIVADEQTS